MSSSKGKNWKPTPPFVLHTLQLVQSPAWMIRPPALVRILDRLEIEHMRHAGSYDYLYVSYGQFVQHGVSRKSIRRALQLGKELGLLEIGQQSELYGGTLRPPNQYRLSYLPRNGEPPPDKWKQVTDKMARQALDQYTAPAPNSPSGRQEKQVPSSPRGLHR
jgi:hypothetical protein